MTILCDRCREDIEKANIIDSNPEIDRLRQTINGVYLPPRLWDMFSLMLLLKKPVSKEEFEDYIFEKTVDQHLIRTTMWTLRKKLQKTSYKIITTHSNIYTFASYEVVKR